MRQIVVYVIGMLMILAGPAMAQDKFCPDAPLPRLVIGGQGEVAPGIDRLRLRALPAVGTGEVRLLYAGNVFEVLAGPSCNGGLSWWRVELDGGTSGWVAEGTWLEYYVRPVSDIPRGVCDRAEIPWLHLLVQASCKLSGAMMVFPFSGDGLAPQNS